MAANNNATQSATPKPQLGRFRNHRLRRASFISPLTGERSKRNFTLREASHRLNGATDPDAIALDGHSGEDGAVRLEDYQTSWERFQETCKEQIFKTYDFWTSSTGLGILKCSLAYFIGSLATLVPAIAGIIGHKQDSKHMVCTVTVWFHPARTIGSMHEATILALIALCYSGFVSFTSMGISRYFGLHDLLLVGHVIVLIVFIGGGLGFVAWTKQRLGHPLVNVACSLASLGCITILIKEGAVQAGAFSYERVLQILLMVFAGVCVVSVINILVLPSTARGSLVKDMEKNTDLLGEMLICITRAFLSGRKADMQDEYYKALNEEHQKSTANLSKNLGEAKRELCFLGKERQYDAEAKIVDSLSCLAQDLGGLRSAAFSQFSFIDDATAEAAANGPNGSTNGPAPSPSKPPPKDLVRYPSILGVITEAPEDTQNGHAVEESPSTTADFSADRRMSLDSQSGSLEAPSEMFLAFLAQLGPPTKSLVFTLKQILDELPFRKRAQQGWWARYANVPRVDVATNDTLHSSLRSAIELYRLSRNEALQKLYASRAVNAANLAAQGAGKGVKGFGSPRSVSTISVSPAPGSDRKAEALVADIEEVSACCGHFSFSLLDFSEDILTYLDALDELKDELEHPRHSWHWLFPWHWKQNGTNRHKPHRTRQFSVHSEEHDMPHELASHIQQADDFAGPAQPKRPWTYTLYKALRVFRRDDVRFAIKVGLGALLYALPAFIESSRPFFVHWRGEWGLVSYMAVCSMTVGASNTTTINRFIGTGIGAALAILAWLMASDGHGDANPWLLGVLGWMVSVGCFYLIIAKNNGPMGRFILLTYNLGALYSYSLSVQDDDNDDDEGGIDPAIWDIVVHRLAAVVVGCLWAILVTRLIWPISARKKLKEGLCILWLRMALVWKRDPLALFLLGAPRSSYMDIREESALRSYLSMLEGLRKAAASEFELRGPFPSAPLGSILERTGQMLDSFHAMNVVISKNLQYTPGEAAVLRYTRPERFALSARISHLFGVLASSVKLEYPLNDVLPSIDHTRDRLLARIAEFRRSGEGREMASEQDYELLYAYVLVTGQLSHDIQVVSAEIETLYGTLDEEHLKLQ